jgi:type II restriction enzyme
MKLGFEEAQTPYVSGSQSARAWTEQWAGNWVYCPNCGNSKLDQFEKNRSVADFFCVKCNEEYELKSHVTSSRNTNRWLTRLGEPVGLDATFY